MPDILAQLVGVGARWLCSFLFGAAVVETEAVQDGGYAAQQLMEESKQSVEEVKRVVAEARRKEGLSPQAPQAADFNEDDYMDGMTSSPSSSPAKVRSAKYVRPPTITTHHPVNHVLREKRSGASFCGGDEAVPRVCF